MRSLPASLFPGQYYHMPALYDAEREYGSVQGLGTPRVNGAPATLDTPVTEGATLLIIPKVEGGC
jgi:molybdopterin converting factor small subunit